MFDFSWGDGGVTIYWPNNNGGTGNIPPGAQYNPYTPVSQTTQISNTTLLLLAVAAFLIFRK